MARTRTWSRKMEGIYVARAVLYGASPAEAAAIYGIHPTAALTLIRRTLRAAAYPTRLKTPIPPHDTNSIAEAREHATFWLRQLRVLQNDWAAEDFVREGRSA